MSLFYLNEMLVNIFFLKPKHWAGLTVVHIRAVKNVLSSNHSSTCLS